MTFFRYLPVCIIVLVLSGCTLTQPLPSDLPEQVERWRTNQEYDRALNMLDKVRSDHPRYIDLIRLKLKIREEAKDFADDIAEQAAEAWHAGEWATAHERLEYGLQRYSQSEHLQQVRRRFEAQRRTYLNTVQQQIDLNKAPYLARELHLQQTMAKAAPDDPELAEQARRTEAELDAVYARLATCGVKAKRQQQWPLAQRCLSLATQLKPNAALQAALQDVKSRVRNQARYEANTLGAESQQALQDAREQLAKDNVKEALQAFKRIDHKHAEHPAVVDFKAKLDEHIAQSVEEGIDIGRRFYTQGKVERALAVWHALKALDPQHKELNAHINRAERVLSKIKRLRQDEGILPPEQSHRQN